MSFELDMSKTQWFQIGRSLKDLEKAPPFHQCAGTTGFRLLDEGAKDCMVRSERGGVVVFTCSRCGAEFKV